SAPACVPAAVRSACCSRHRQRGSPAAPRAMTTPASRHWSTNGPRPRPAATSRAPTPSATSLPARASFLRTRRRAYAGSEAEPMDATTHFPIEATAADAQAAIRDEFAFFGDWSERYQYLIDLGRKLPEVPAEFRTEAHRLHGCQSMVWIVPSGDADRLDFAAASDSAIVSGLVYLALRVYSGRSAQEILANDPSYIADIGLAKHLSPTRSNGLASLLAFIRDAAQRALG